MGLWLVGSLTYGACCLCLCVALLLAMLMCVRVYVCVCVCPKALLSADLGYLTSEEPPEVYVAFDQLVTYCSQFAEQPHQML